MNKLKGESRFLPNLHFDLSDVQLRDVTSTLQKLEQAHRTRIVWMGPYSIEENRLSIHALDLLTVLSYCQRSSENEMDLFRLRKAAMDKLNDLARSAQNEIKKQNLEMWLESYQKLWPGAESATDLAENSVFIAVAAFSIEMPMYCQALLIFKPEHWMNQVKCQHGVIFKLPKESLG